jgi:hypothetical protein
MDLRGGQTLLWLFAGCERDGQHQRKNDSREPSQKAMYVWIAAGTKLTAAS